MSYNISDRAVYNACLVRFPCLLITRSAVINEVINFQCMIECARCSIAEIFNELLIIRRKFLIKRNGKQMIDDEGHLFEYFEQDISEQLRKSIQQYLEGGAEKL